MTTTATPPVVATFASRLRQHADARPDAIAVRVARAGATRFDELTYGALAERSARIAAGLATRGVRPGERVALFVRPGTDLVALVHALLHLGAVPVLIDPGMGRARLLDCIEKAAPVALIGVARAQLARRLFPRAFRSLRLAVAVGAGPRFGAVPLADVERGKEAPPHQPAPDDAAAILFTSGSTGPPKGVVATHANLAAQLDALAELFRIRPGDVDLACFPLFALFDTALGATSLFPEVDPTRPAACDPARVLGAIERGGATLGFGSPAIWRRLASHRDTQALARLDRLLTAGAPVPPSLVARLREDLPPGGDVHTPYGATECLPVSTTSGAELLATRSLCESGAGTCIGREATLTEVRIVRPTEGPIAHEDELVDVAPGEIGEIIARGPQVTPAYLFDDAATRRAKVPGHRGIWHRMGDLGRRDEGGRLWFQGRVAEALVTRDGLVPTTPLEAVVDACPGVARSALVGAGERGAQRAVLVVELDDGSLPKGAHGAREAERIRAFARERYPAMPELERVLFRRAFPVDVRHNAKIHRLELARWAARA